MGIWTDIAEDYRAYKRPLIQQGFWAVCIHRYGSAVNNIKAKWIFIPLRIIHHMLIKFSEIFFSIYIGPNAVIGKRFVIEHFGCVVINSQAKIGNDVRIRHEVTIGNGHVSDPDAVPVIGDRVDIGAGAKILGRITVGSDVVIGANAVVIRDIPDNSLAVGVPAIVKPRH